MHLIKEWHSLACCFLFVCCLVWLSHVMPVSCLPCSFCLKCPSQRAYQLVIPADLMNSNTLMNMSNKLATLKDNNWKTSRSRSARNRGKGLFFNRKAVCQVKQKYNMKSHSNLLLDKKHVLLCNPTTYALLWSSTKLHKRMARKQMILSEFLVYSVGKWQKQYKNQQSNVLSDLRRISNFIKTKG